MIQSYYKRRYFMNKIDKYILDKCINQDIFNPTYLFHGSPIKLEELEPRQSKDNINEENEDNAIFLTSFFPTATAYAFRNKLKENNEHYSFLINNNGQIPAMEFEIDNIPEKLFGYVYIFKKDESMIKDNHEHTCQYRCYHKIKPIYRIKVYYDDYKIYFTRKTNQRR